LKREILSRKRHVDLARSEGAGTVAQRQAQESALWLLERSLVLGHRRLGALRLVAALEIGCELSPRHRQACHDLLKSAAGDTTLRPVWEKALVLLRNSS